MIKSLLNESTIRLKVEVSDWSEAGRKAGELLLQNNSIEEAYIDKMIEAVYEFGPYIVIAKGIALFHARPEDTVKEICLSMITLNQAVSFGAGEKDPVDLIFALGAIDHDSHLQAISGLIKILRDEELLTQIRNGNRVESVLDLIYQKIEQEE
ncbi:PTS sugar transporter subunit IIA [Bacillus timonensis]|uniref:PTS sugar transporter subunit IIA n=1 Tax=Bacillus timonensis TaxID=1033734 RepID=UPI000288E228|nr:PTS sugar transporter subunit IIA [Bacillus timonensis]